MPGAGGGSRGVYDTGASLVTMNSGFPKSQDLRLLAGPRLCSQLPFLEVILVVSLEH